MGYNTDYRGEISIEPALTESDREILEDFIDRRHEDSPISIWCDLELNEDGTAIRWNETEKSYNLDGWLSYIANVFLNGAYRFNGVMHAQGQDADDKYKIVVEDNHVTKVKAKIVWPYEQGSKAQKLIVEQLNKLDKLNRDIANHCRKFGTDQDAILDAYMTEATYINGIIKGIKLLTEEPT